MSEYRFELLVGGLLLSGLVFMGYSIATSPVWKVCDREPATIAQVGSACDRTGTCAVKYTDGRMGYASFPMIGKQVTRCVEGQPEIYEVTE